MKKTHAPLPPTPSPLRSEGEPFPSTRSGEGLGEGMASRSGQGLGEGMASRSGEESTGNTLYTRTTLEIWDKIKPFARQMRHEPTPAEDKLWQRLRRKALGNYKFRRQHPIDRFIVDFFCAEARLVVEVDGEIHDYTQEEDALRTEFLESLGLRVLRFTNSEVFQQTDGVIERIAEVLQLPHP